MFRNFREGLKRFVDRVGYTEITLDRLERFRDDILMFLLENDVAYDAAERFIDSFFDYLRGARVKRFSDMAEVVFNHMKSYLRKIFSGLEYRDLSTIDGDGEPLKILVVGVNGTGKTTTIAKMAYRSRQAGLRPLLVCADTFRAGAIEQLKEHAMRIGVDVYASSYGHDPAAVAYDAIQHAAAKGYDQVIIDTAGRQHSNINLMAELAKIRRVAEPDVTVLVLDALTGSDAIRQADEFDRGVRIDAYIFTKVDADVKGGAILTTAFVKPKPIAYLGVGQRYSDLIPFKADLFVSQLFST